MASEDLNDMISIARDHFIDGRYSQAESILQQVLLKNNQIPEVFQMLATIFYDRGKFNKAIKTFKRALEIDPNYTDASVGLSIILNDLGRYEEGREIFQEAKDLLDKRSKVQDPFVNEILAKKHEELGDLYSENKRHNEAVHEYQKARALLDNGDEITLKLADALVKDDKASHAIKDLKNLLNDKPHFNPARLKLGLIYYDSNKIIEAVEQWENVLLRDPSNADAKNYLHLAQKVGVVEPTSARSPSPGVS